MSFYIPQNSTFIIGPSLATGAKKVTNENFIEWIGAKIKPSLIDKRTGITERYWASDKQAVTDLGILSVNDLKSEYPDCLNNLAHLIFSTVSSDYPVPPSAPLLQDKLQLKNVGAFDLGAACAGFVTSLITASQMSNGFKKDVLLCSSEIRSKFLDKKNFETSVLFGDGSSSCVISLNKKNASFKLLGGQLFSDGEVADIISIPDGGSRNPFNMDKDFYPYLKMKGGAELYIKALNGMYETSKTVLKNLDFKITDIDWIVPHQANLHMIKALANKFDFPMERVVQTVKIYGNTSGASVGMALNYLRKNYPIKKNQKALLISAGGGGLAANAVLEIL